MESSSEDVRRSNDCISLGSLIGKVDFGTYQATASRPLASVGSGFGLYVLCALA